MRPEIVLLLAGFALLTDAVAMAEALPADRRPPSLETARQVLAVRPEVMTNMWDWSRDGAVVQAARAQLSQVLDKLVTTLGREAFDKYVDQKAQARRRQNNELYQKRLQAFLASPQAVIETTQPATTSAPARP